jgi:hypothetical protein
VQQQRRGRHPGEHLVGLERERRVGAGCAAVLRLVRELVEVAGCVDASAVFSGGGRELLEPWSWGVPVRGKMQAGC